MDTTDEMRTSASASRKVSAQETLLKRISTDDTDAIVWFVLKYQGRVFAAAMDVLHDEGSAANATRATFTRALQQLRQGIRTGQTEPWLLWIARNEAVTRIHDPHGNAVATDDAMAAARTFLAQKTYPRALLERAQPGSNTTAKQSSHVQLSARHEKASWRLEEPDCCRSTKTAGSVWKTLLILFMILVILVLAWVALGLLAKNEKISLPDLGYNRFSRHIFPLF